MAVKIILTKDADREVKLMNGLQHQNVVEMFTFCTYGLTTAIAMELCPSSLEKQISAFPDGLPVMVLHNILKDIIDGYQYLHTLGIMHNDLKPENILIGTDYKYKIADFGLSVVLKKNQRSTFAAGTILSSNYLQSIASETTNTEQVLGY